MHSAVLLCVLSSLRFCASAILDPVAEPEPEPEPELLLSTPAWNVSGTTDTASLGYDYLYTYEGEAFAVPLPPQNRTLSAASYAGSSVWTGAGCVIYNLTSDVTATFSTALYDFGAFYIGQQATNVNTCSGGACMRRVTVKLDPSKYYALNFTNTGSQGIWIALDYSLHPSNSSECQGAGVANTTSRAAQSASDQTDRLLGLDSLGLPTAGTPAVVYQDILEQGPATIIGALRGATCISGLLNVTFFDTSTSATLALFSTNSTLSFSSGTSDYWTSVANCFVDIANPLCTFNSSPLLSNAPDYFVAVIPTVTTSDSDATNSLSSALGGIYTARYQALTADACPNESNSSSLASSSTFYSTVSSLDSTYSPSPPYSSSSSSKSPSSSNSPSSSYTSVSSLDSTYSSSPPYSSSSSSKSPSSSYTSASQYSPSSASSTSTPPVYSGSDNGDADALANDTPVVDANGDTVALGAASVADSTPDYNNPATYDTGGYGY
ncbi:hypothetical protein ABBQ38_000678 [Trebouxia sp. C0009 RCD-2024]